MSSPLSLADLRIAEWLPAHGTSTPPALDAAALRGRVVVILAFQMLCPGCVAHALPLAARVRRIFPAERVAVIGLHTVFEHHEAMTPTALRAFAHEYRLPFALGVDTPGGGPIPQSMRRFAMRGTPSWLLFDAEGRLRSQAFGEIDALALGAGIADLLHEAAPPIAPRTEAHIESGDRRSAKTQDGCDADGCMARGTESP
jgi:hypothetical protein